MALSYTGFNDGCNEALDMICVPNEIRMSFQWSRNKISKHTLHKCMDKYDNLQHSVIVHSQWYANELRSSLLSFDVHWVHMTIVTSTHDFQYGNGREKSAFFNNSWNKMSYRWHEYFGWKLNMSIVRRSNASQSLLDFSQMIFTTLNVMNATS